MSILQSFERIQKVWYLIGLAPCHIHSENRKDKICYRRVPVVIFFIINIFLTLLQFFSFYLKSFGLINQLLYYIFYAVTLISNVTANWQCWHYGSTYQNIIHRVQLLENACKLKFAMKLSYGTIKRRYIVTALLIWGFYFIAAPMVLIQTWFISSENPNIPILIALCTLLKDLICVMAVLHFTLYVDIVRSFIAELNKQIRWSPIYIHTPMQVDFLKDVKLVHMDMFLLIKEINGFFGWHLLVLAIHYLVLITNEFFWIFMILHNKGIFFSIAEGTFSLIYGCVSVRALITSCEYCSIETLHLMEKLERFGFYSFDNDELYRVKNELIKQITNFRLDVTAKGYFTLNRRLILSIAGSCCTYLIIMIQFFLYKNEAISENALTKTNSTN